MGIFKKKMSAEDILEAIKTLSDEEQTVLYQKLVDNLEKEEETPSADSTEQKTSDDDATANGKPNTEEQIEKAEEDIAEKGTDSQTEKDRIDESVAEQEKDEGDEDSQDAKDRVDESEAERVDAEDNQEVNAAVSARIDALEEQLATISERIEQMLSNLENKDFGVHHGGGEEKPASKDDEAYMDAYYAKQQRRK